MSMDTVIKRPGLWRRIISQIRVSLSGEGILYRADAKGGWFEIPFSGHKEEGKAHRYLKDGRICETSVYRAGQIEEHTERYWADIRFRLPRKSPNYLENFYRQGELIEQRSLFRLCYTITPMKNNKPEGRACIYRPIEANQPPVSAQTKTWGHLCLHETREYHDGVEQGMRYSYYQNGQLRSEGVWKTKKVYFAFSDKQYNERLKTNPSFKARRMVGEKGSIVYVHEDLISYPQGEHKEYYPNGKMKNFSLYDEDIRDFTEFDEEGNVCYARREGANLEGVYLRDEGIQLSFKNAQGERGDIEIQPNGQRLSQRSRTQKVQGKSLPQEALVFLDGFYSYEGPGHVVIEELYKTGQLRQKVIYQEGKAVLAQKIDDLGNGVDLPVCKRIKPSRLLTVLKEAEKKMKNKKLKETQHIPRELFSFGKHQPHNTIE